MFKYISRFKSKLQRHNEKIEHIWYSSLDRPMSEQEFIYTRKSIVLFENRIVKYKTGSSKNMIFILKTHFSGFPHFFYTNDFIFFNKLFVGKIYLESSTEIIKQYIEKQWNTVDKKTIPHVSIEPDPSSKNIHCFYAVYGVDGILFVNPTILLEIDHIMSEKCTQSSKKIDDVCGFNILSTRYISKVIENINTHGFYFQIFSEKNSGNINGLKSSHSNNLNVVFRKYEKEDHRILAENLMKKIKREPHSKIVLRYIKHQQELYFYYIFLYYEESLEITCIVMNHLVCPILIFNYLNSGIDPPEHKATELMLIKKNKIFDSFDPDNLVLFSSYGSIIKNYFLHIRKEINPTYLGNIRLFVKKDEWSFWNLILFIRKLKPFIFGGIILIPITREMEYILEMPYNIIGMIENNRLEAQSIDSGSLFRSSKDIHNDSTPASGNTEEYEPYVLDMLVSFLRTEQPKDNISVFETFSIDSKKPINSFYNLKTKKQTFKFQYKDPIGLWILLYPGEINYRDILYPIQYIEYICRRCCTEGGCKLLWAKKLICNFILNEKSENENCIEKTEESISKYLGGLGWKNIMEYISGTPSVCIKVQNAFSSNSKPNINISNAIDVDWDLFIITNKKTISEKLKTSRYEKEIVNGLASLSTEYHKPSIFNPIYKNPTVFLLCDCTVSSIDDICCINRDCDFRKKKNSISPPDIERYLPGGYDLFCRFSHNTECISEYLFKNKLPTYCLDDAEISAEGLPQSKIIFKYTHCKKIKKENIYIKLDKFFQILDVETILGFLDRGKMNDHIYYSIQLHFIVEGLSPIL